MIQSKGEIVIYTDPDGTVQTDVRLEAETLWLSQKMMAELFDRDVDTIGLHLKNIYSEEELEEKATTEDFSVVQTEGKRRVKRRVKFYNLDAILSVGYRVNSKRGTQFRIWANRVLKEHLVQGYSINPKRLAEQQNQIARLKESIRMVERSLLDNIETVDQARSVIKILSDFSQGLEILDSYDHESLETNGKTHTPAVVIEKQEFLDVVSAMRRKFDSELFGKPKDNSFDSSVCQMYQSFAGTELYPTIEHKAAILLYLVVKNHSFIDGNKRIAAALFLYFLEKNKLLTRPDGQRTISNDGLAALTLLMAVSKPQEKDTMIQIAITIMNLRQV
ncbi:virulence protein RhuM/Fic/DOC family protein [bacterium]|nr:virulence protein RhuM/Fic/DOC family protein [bacterium]